MAKKVSFEDSMKKLEDIVASLEKGEVSLNDSLKLYEEGSKLVAECTALLDEAEQKVSLITRGSGDSYTEEAFEE